MAEQPRKKLTKAEAGRLGGLRTKQRHGTEHFRRAGSLGGKALLAKYGPEHYRRIGKAGFLALAIRIGLWNPRDVQSGRSGRPARAPRPARPRSASPRESWLP